MDNGALHCCSRNLKEQNLGDFLDFDPLTAMGEKLTDHRNKMAEKKQQAEEEKRRAEKKSKFLKSRTKNGL